MNMPDFVNISVPLPRKAYTELADLSTQEGRSIAAQARHFIGKHLKAPVTVRPAGRPRKEEK
jgi:hypothetical protein